MLDASMLIVYAACVGHGGGFVLSRQRFIDNRPRLGLVLWLTALVSFLLANALAAMLLALDSAAVRFAASDVLSGCLSAWHQHASRAPVTAIIGSIFLVCSVSWLAVQGALVMTHTWTARRRHRAVLDYVGTPDHTLRVVVLQHPSIHAYCLPGRGGRVVVTSGAMEAMSPAQVDAVLAHERAHLQGRHSFVTGTVHWLATALPHLPLARRAEQAVGFLIERAADESASRQCGRAAVASALLVVNRTLLPLAVLGVSGESAEHRARLLLTPDRAGSTRQLLTTMLLTLAMIVVPLALALGPTIGLDWTGHCLVAPVA